MRLCYVGDVSSCHTRRWVDFFARRKYDVHVISTTDRRCAELSNVTMHSLTLSRRGSYTEDLVRGLFAMPARVSKLRRLLRELHPDVVHVHYINEAALFSVCAGIRPMVLTAWGSDILVSPEKSWIRKQAVKYTLKRADAITCDADHMKQRMVSLGADPEKVRVIFFGTDVERFHPGRRDPELRRRFAADGGPVVISIRTLEPVYDVASLIRAIPAVLARFPEAVFLIGGTGSLAAALAGLAAELGVQDSVRFLGALSQEALPAYLASSDVYVSTALSDGGIAASTAEAMASSLPVVITDVADNRQWVEDGASGFLVPPGQPGVLAQRIVQLLEAEGMRARMGARSRQIIAERNNLHTEMSKVERLYQSLAGGPQRRHL
ncbi:MAG: glycosyltransferase family 4 protein [Acidobacteriota bacterium]